MDKDYYAILGIHPSAEEAVISAAYRALAKLYHPDLYKGSDAAEMMVKINEAYETLSDEGRRKKYDATRSNNLPEDDPILDSTEYNDEEFFGEDWSLAIEYYPEAAREAAELAKISSKLAFAYKA
jgi:curved DNA-binding protein CbpA